MSAPSNIIQINNKNLLERGDALYALSTELLESCKVKEALNYAKKSIEIYEIEEASSQIIKTSIHISKLHILNGDFHEADIFCKKALFLAQENNDKFTCILILNQLGTIKRKELNYSKALFYILEAKKQAETNFFKKLLPFVYNNLGKTYRKLEKYDESINLLSQSITIYNDSKENDPELKISILSNIGSCYFETKDFLNALSYYESALSIALDSNIESAIASVYTKIARLYINEQQYDESITCLERSLYIYTTKNNSKGLAITYLDLGYSYLKKSLFNKSKESLSLALDLSFSLSLKDYIVVCYEYFAELYESMGEYHLALEHYKSYSEIKNNLITEKNDNYLSRLYAQYQIDNMEKEKEIYRLKNIELVKAHNDLKLAYDKMEFMATKDPLTGLLNRRAMMTRIDLEKNRFNRKKSPLSIILSDIDHFKKVNDTYGHDVGDEILIELSKVFTTTLRSTDAICRWGGEEFLILLPETNIQAAFEVGEKLRSAIQNHNFNDALPKGSITTTMGIAQFENNLSIKKWIKYADEALYCGKESGRNCVQISKNY